MLTGRPAVTGNNVFEVMHKIANVPFEPPSAINHEVDEQLDHIVMKALLKNAGERYNDAAEMRHALAQYLRPAAATTATHPTMQSPCIRQEICR